MSAGQLSLEDWGNALALHCAGKLRACVSPTSLAMHRAGFGQTVRPKAGSVVASPVTDLHGDPDYFFHWLRDSAIVMDAGRILYSGDEARAIWADHFRNFVQFSLDLGQIDGRDFLSRSGFRAHTVQWMQQYLRADNEIAEISAETSPAEARYNADGTLDFLRWPRPQYDGPALRALVLMKFAGQVGSGDNGAKDRVAALIRQDLTFTAAKAGHSCYDIWEEEPAQHYYTALVQMAALEEGAGWAERSGEEKLAAGLRSKAAGLRDLLELFWSPTGGFLCSRLADLKERHPKALDFSVILGVLHAGLETGPHSIEDERVFATLQKLESLFAAQYAINRGGGEDGIALGRYEGDVYYSGGAYYFCSFGAAEFYYRLAQKSPDGRKLLAKGDAILSHVRRFVPASGDLSEQYDRTTGQQTSAKDLSWSYAAFLTAWHARKLALGVGAGVS